MSVADRMGRCEPGWTTDVLLGYAFACGSSFSEGMDQEMAGEP